LVSRYHGLHPYARPVHGSWWAATMDYIHMRVRSGRWWAAAMDYIHMRIRPCPLVSRCLPSPEYGRNRPAKSRPVLASTNHITARQGVTLATRIQM